MPKVPRPVLLQYFQTGDKPTQQQFATMLDSMVNFVDDRDLIGLRSYNPALDYLPGDCAVFNDQVVKCITATTGAFNPAHWTVLASFGSVNYAGTWDTQNNVPTLQSSVGTQGFYYVVTNASSDPNDNTELDGTDDWANGDWAIFNGSIWEKVENSATPVQASNVSFVPTPGISATNVQDAIEELAAEVPPPISLTPNFYPYASAANTLSDGVISNQSDGVAVSVGKVIRSEIAGEAQIDFGLTGDNIILSTDGTAGMETRVQLTPFNLRVNTGAVALFTNDSTGTLTLFPNTVNLSNDGGAGTDGALLIQPGEVSLKQVTNGGISITPGLDMAGRTEVTGGAGSVLLTNDVVQLATSWGAGGTIRINSTGTIEASANNFQVNSPGVKFLTLAPSTVPVVDSTQNLVSSAVTPTELSYLSGATAPLQPQFNNKVNRTGDTMTGDLILNADPTDVLGAATKNYVDVNVSAKVNKTGDTMTGDLVLNADPSAPLGAATKQYVDNSTTGLQTQVNAKVNRSGDTMTGPLILSGNPTLDFGAATKLYVDNSVGAKVSKAGDTMTGTLVLNADPVGPLDASTKQYTDAGDNALQAQLNAKVDRGGDTMTGPLILDADPTLDFGAATKQYVDSGVGSKVSKAGDTMTGNLVLNADPTAPLGAATKQYVDAGTSGLQTQVNAKVNRSGDTMTGPLILNANPVLDFGAATKLYVDNSVGTKVSKAGDAMTGALLLNADPIAPLGAATKQYVDAADSNLLSQVNGKVSKAGDTMTGFLILNADPTSTFGAATKRYVDTGDGVLLGQVNAKVSKAGDTMTGLLTLSGDPTAALGAATKQYVDGATKKLLIPFTFDTDYGTNSVGFASIPLQVIIPAASTVFPGTTAIAARLTIDYLLDDGAVAAQGEAGLTEWTTATTASPSLIPGSLIDLSGAPNTWRAATTPASFPIAEDRSYRIIFRKTVGSGSTRVRIESASLSVYYT